MSRSLADGSGGGGVAAVVVFGGTDGGGSMAAPEVEKKVRYFSLFFIYLFVFLVVDG